MKRTTISLPDNLALALQREARRRSSSVSEIARQALGAHLGVGQRKRRTLAFAALGKSGERHTARDLEEILDDEWGDARRR